jgi:hypothetical protein
LVDSSPWLFAATHVLHRHLAPRHPPLALHSLKSHSPRAFERAENSFEDRGPTTYFQDARARYAVLKVPAETKLVSPAAVWIAPEQSSTERHPICRLNKRHGAASSKQSSEGRTVRRLGGAGDGPADQAPKSSLSWRVHQGRGGVVTPHIPVLDVGTSR